MISLEIIEKMFYEELNERYFDFIDDIDKEKLKKDFIEYLELDIYDWFKSNFNSFISNLNDNNKDIQKKVI